jgi:hypothetical protein
MGKARKKATSGSGEGERHASAGEATLAALYHDLLQVDDEWAVRGHHGFTWWPDQHAQTVELVGVQEVDPDDPDIDETGPGYLMAVRTELLSGLTLDADALLVVRELMGLAAMAGPVYDPEAGTLALASQVSVHAGNFDWMARLLALAAVLQIHEVRELAEKMAVALGARSATSGHPERGPRPQADELATALVPNLVVPQGGLPSKWSRGELRELHERFLGGPPAVAASYEGSQLLIELPFGAETSLCRFQTDQRHARYGQGLMLVQSFPVGPLPEAEGTRLALSFNQLELAGEPLGYGFGSYRHEGDCLHFVSFLPNVAWQPGLLPNWYLAAAQRAALVAEELGVDDHLPAN